MKITTKTGDDGFTSLLGGKRVSKASCFIEAVGDLDELNSFLGWVKSEKKAGAELIKLVERVQDNLYRMMAVIGSGLKCPKNVAEIGESDVEFIGEEILKRQKNVEKLRKFVVPGGGELSSRLHIARSVCRRAERSLIMMKEELLPEKEVGLGERNKADVKLAGDAGLTESLKYLNRLSDLLFILGVAKSAKT